MPAKTKADLLAVTLREYDLFMQDIARVAPALRLHPDPDAHGTTLKDIVGHRAHWIEMFLTWYHEGAAGHEVAFPAKGYKWNELPRFNADLRAAQSDLTWQDACDMLQRNHARLVGFLNDLSQDQLYGGPMPGAKNHWTTGRWAEAAGPSHYRSARKYLRQRMRSSKNAPAVTLE